MNEEEIFDIRALTINLNEKFKYLRIERFFDWREKEPIKEVIPMIKNQFYNSIIKKPELINIGNISIGKYYSSNKHILSDCKRVSAACNIFYTAPVGSNEIPSARMIQIPLYEDYVIKSI